MFDQELQFLQGIFRFEKLSELKRCYGRTQRKEIVESVKILLGRLQLDDRIDACYIDQDIDGKRCLFLDANFGNVGPGAVQEVYPL